MRQTKSLAGSMATVAALTQAHAAEKKDLCLEHVIGIVPCAPHPRAKLHTLPTGRPGAVEQCPI